MKRVSRMVFLLLLATLVIPSIVIRAFAFEYTNYDTEYVLPEKMEEFLEATNIDLLTNEEYDCAFTHFALGETGLIALGFNTGKYAVIYVYDSDGQFQYGYRFINNNCAFAFYFEENRLTIHWAKSNYIGQLDADGNIHYFRKVINTPRNHDTYSANRYRSASGRVGGFQYYTEGNWLSHKYSCFIIEDDDGNRTVIYDVTEAVRSKNIVFSVLFTSVAALVLFLIYKDKTKNNDH